jgi:hypothetical protein
MQITPSRSAPWPATAPEPSPAPRDARLLDAIVRGKRALDNKRDVLLPVLQQRPDRLAAAVDGVAGDAIAPWLCLNEEVSIGGGERCAFHGFCWL